MLINLTQSVPLKELCKVTAVGHTDDTAERIEFVLSREAILGFATELLWIYEYTSDNRELVLATHQLQVDPAPNQVVGFYVTSDSPTFVLKVNTLSEKKEEEYECRNWKEINIKDKNTNQYYCIKDVSYEEKEFITLEPYELSRRNIMSINVFDAEDSNINAGYSSVIFEINRMGIKEFATMLLVWANNCKEGDEYELPHIDKSDCGYNLGIVLAHNNIAVKFKCGDLGTAHDYDSRF